MSRRVRSYIVPFASLAGGIAIGFGFSISGLSRAFLHRASQFDQAPRAHGAVVQPGVGQLADDPLIRIVSAVNEGNFLKGSAELYRLLEHADVSELPKLIEKASRLPLKYREQIVPAIFAHWLTIDSGQALNWLRSVPPNEACYQQWAEFAPEDFLREMLEAGGRINSTAPINAALDRIAGEDSYTRLEVLIKFPQSSHRDAPLKLSFENWCRQDPAAAIKWAASLPDGRLRDALERAALQHLIVKDPADAVNRVQRFIPNEPSSIFGDAYISAFARSLASKDPRMAIKFAQELPENLRTYPLIGAGIGWAETDPLAALDWSYESGIDPSAAYRDQYAYPTNPPSILSKALSVKPREVVDWILALPEDENRNRFLAVAVSSLRKDKDGDLIQLVFDQLPPEQQLRFAPALGESVAARGNFPTEEMWASMIPDEAARRRAVASAVGKIHGSQPQRAEAIIAAFPDEASRDYANSQIALQASDLVPQSAERAMHISDNTIRYDTLDRVILRWLIRDRKAAQAWLEGQRDIPAEWMAEWTGDR
jgi:hypothetical protein